MIIMLTKKTRRNNVTRYVQQLVGDINCQWAAFPFVFPLMPFTRVSCPAFDIVKLSEVKPGVKALIIPFIGGPPDVIDFWLIGDE
jgi:hypothetical protein